ncbi:MAG: helix-hairpin-helix domain-containing protein, partial [Caldilineaceae bacterium]|nr:helix-hairpin-helix domain-containing protein [Caldilineaceae bacterium]
MVADLHVDQRADGHAVSPAASAPPDGLERITGILPGIREGARLEVEGEYRIHQAHGRQFAVSRHRFIQPTSKEGLIGFLGSGLLKGVGEATARQVVGKFGKRTLEVLDSEPERLAELRGISPRKARVIGDHWREVAGERELAAYLQHLGVSLSLARRIRQEFGDNAVQVLKQNPYLLTRMQGIGFQRADQMALSIGIRRNDPSRLRTALQYVLGEQTTREGHVFLPEHELVEEALKQVGPPATRDEVQAQLDLLIRDEDLIVTEAPGHARWQPQTDWTVLPEEPVRNEDETQGRDSLAQAGSGGRQVYPPWNYHSEKDLADRLRKRIGRPELSPLCGRDFDVEALLDAAAERGTPLNRGQRDIVESITKQSPGVATIPWNLTTEQNLPIASGMYLIH